MANLYGTICGDSVLLSPTFAAGTYPVIPSDEPTEVPAGYKAVAAWTLADTNIVQSWSFVEDNTEKGAQAQIQELKDQLAERDSQLDELQAALVELADMVGGSDESANTAESTDEGSAE